MAGKCSLPSVTGGDPGPSLTSSAVSWAALLPSNSAPVSRYLRSTCGARGCGQGQFGGAVADAGPGATRPGFTHELCDLRKVSTLSVPQFFTFKMGITVPTSGVFFFFFRNSTSCFMHRDKVSAWDMVSVVLNF